MSKTARVIMPVAMLLSASAVAQEPDRFVKVKAPFAERLVHSISARHPEMEFIGLHVTPSGQQDNVIIACTDSTKIGKVSTSLDMEVVTNKQTKVHFNKEHNYYEVDQWFADSAGTTLGMVVYHIAGTRAADEKDAVKLAEAIRTELEKNIPNRQRLFDAR